MKRTQIYISERMQEELDRLSRKRGTSKSEIIREAVTKYISRHSESERKKKLKAGAGLWKEKKDLSDLSKLHREFVQLKVDNFGNSGTKRMEWGWPMP